MAENKLKREGGDGNLSAHTSHQNNNDPIFTEHKVFFAVDISTTFENSHLKYVFELK